MRQSSELIRLFLGTAVNNSLSKYLSEAKINFGETPHSFGVGLSNILNMLGCLQDKYLLISGEEARVWLNIASE